MRVAYLTGVRQLAIRDAPEPQLANADDVLLRIDAVGVCGSDLHYYTTGRIGFQVLNFPETVGHECAGTVLAAGPAVRGLRVGQRVAIDPLIACGQCDQCLAGREHTCRRQMFLGCPGQAPGALAERLVMPARCCYPVPDSVTAEQAAMVEPFSVALHSRNQARLGPGAKLAILGSGPIGLAVLLACRAAKDGSSYRVYATDLVEERLQAAAQAGADWTGNPRREDVVRAMIQSAQLGLDAVFECAGQQETLDQAVELLKPGGTLVMVGIPELDRVSFDPHALRRHELEIRNVRRQNRCVARAVEMVATGAVNVDSLITHRFNLSETQRAFDLVAARGEGVIKAMIEVSGRDDRQGVHVSRV
ncbi:MAG TPA: alcohol dehydrogenase catalytic domain-containing protein [Terriglobia bacterium]|nr:alcohol dehydrogenase catalytic domain-containing protein [Terriglobia bacterium]